MEGGICRLVMVEAKSCSNKGNSCKDRLCSCIALFSNRGGWVQVCILCGYQHMTHILRKSTSNLTKIIFKFGLFLAHVENKIQPFKCSQNHMLFSHVKISSFRTKAHLVFHWCLYNKVRFFPRWRPKTWKFTKYILYGLQDTYLSPDVYTFLVILRAFKWLYLIFNMGQKKTKLEDYFC